MTDATRKGPNVDCAAKAAVQGLTISAHNAVIVIIY
ncbi:hypothetical protein AFE_2874 [Acidithiobacillus ferrooxidans ATCC 23270]|jgi:hypothetical protein|uniref:Uncharacterized protein n=1 Tax=Acidithiobacillus ferrooxidans (strain ATCC 23270 / DSM 14882 / CIP 104768 / NCIMB 8455) TaxID=243159 RepID=B7J967_ACIF2|nr:hypothetical protein AFE_2874 [Acidithiobacillus ferrooxidans ATCC 23270]